MKRISSVIKLACPSFIFVSGIVFAAPSWDGEKLALEISMQQRVEAALSKIVEPDKFVVVVQVEPLAVPIQSNERSRSVDDGFYLPGVPARRNLDPSNNAVEDLVDTLKDDQKGFARFVRRVSATLVLDRSIDEDKVEKIRELTRQILGLNAKRGDTLDIQRTVFNQNKILFEGPTPITVFQDNLKNYWFIISLALILFCITVFLLFVFGPLRGFLNRFVQVLPTLKPNDSQMMRGSRMDQSPDAQIYPALMAQAMGMLPPPQSGPGNGNFSGSLMVENPNKQTTPFSFIRQDHLANLSTLLAKETPEKAAVVLGYLPPEWISRVLSRIDPYMQSEITEHLATTRQLLPEQVEDIEQDLKRRLDYLIGGPDRIIAVYESLDPEGQKKMLDNLKESRPELAEELKQRTFMFEDVAKFEGPSLKVILREVDLETLVLCLKGAKDELKNKVLDNLSPGKAEIVREEMEFSEGVIGRATYEAQKKVVMLIKRLEKEGQIQFPKTAEALPAARFGEELVSGGTNPEFDVQEPYVDKSDLDVLEPDEEDANIEDRIRNFMNRTEESKERFPMEEDKTAADEEMTG